MISLSTDTSRKFGWQNVLSVLLVFWLSCSVFLDIVVMPSLYISGMMAEPNFASAGYSMFWIFNRVELLCAAIALTIVLGLRYSQHPWRRPGQLSLILSVLLVAIAAIDTYALTPTMSALGLHLNWFLPASDVPVGMDSLHMSYWVLDLIKISSVGALWWLYQRMTNILGQE